MGIFFSSLESCGIDSMSCTDDVITALLFMPPTDTKQEIRNMSQYNKCKLHNIQSKDKNIISTIEVHPKKQSAVNKVVIFSHGNASDIYTFYNYLKYFSDTYVVLVVCYDYIGYGLSSEKKPSEEGCRESLEAVASYYVEKYGANNVVLVGQSLGTGVVVDYAMENEWSSAILLISPYKSIPRVIVDIPIESSFRHNTFKSLYKIDSLICPVKIVHGKSDELIPAHHGQYLYDKLTNKSLAPYFVENAGHNDVLWKIPNYIILEVLNA